MIFFPFQNLQNLLDSFADMGGKEKIKTVTLVSRVCLAFLVASWKAAEKLNSFVFV